MVKSAAQPADQPKRTTAEELLWRLLPIPGISGHERAVADFVRQNCWPPVVPPPGSTRIRSTTRLRSPARSGI